jgi:hypothetical protein
LGPAELRKLYHKYGLDGGISIPGRGSDGFFSLCLHLQTASETHPALYPMGIGGSNPSGKATEAWCWLHISSQCRSQEWVELYLHYQYVFMAWYLVKHKENFTFTFAFTMNGH